MKDIDRDLPHDARVERDVLGAVMSGPEWYGRAVAKIGPEDFHLERHRLLFESVGEIDGALDEMIMIDHLRQTDRLDSVGGAAYVASLIRETPNLGELEKHVEIIARDSRRRRAIRTCRRVEVSALKGTEDFERRLESASLDLAAETTLGTRSAQDASEFARLAASRVERRHSQGDWITGQRTYINQLDAITLGIPRGVLSILGARPSVGKTALVLNAFTNIVQAGGRVILYELDMSEEMVSDRILAMLSGASTFEIRSGRMSPEKWKSVATATNTYGTWRDRFRVNYRARSIAQICAEVRRFARSESIDLVAIDHIGHVSGGQGESRYLRVGDVSARLVDLATSTDIPVLALSQLRRDSTESGPPELSNLRESGNLEQDARLVVLMDAPHQRRAEIPKCRVDIIAAKNSEGSAGDSHELHFDLERQRIGPASLACKFCSGPAQREVA